jgi:hypothetical protein
MTDEFRNICNNESDLFNVLVEKLELPRRINKKETKRLLSFVDNVVDYYLQLPAQEGIRYPIIYIPCAKDWAEEVCIEYLMYKIEIRYDAQRMGFLKKYLYQYSDERTNDELQLRRSIRPIINIIRNINLGDDNVKNMFLCGQGLYNRIIDKQILKFFLGDSPNTSITCSTVIDAEEANVDYREIENIFCFYSQNGICDDYAINSLNNWNGLKNCFIFEFNSAPYSLNSVIKTGEKLYRKYTSNYLLSRDDTLSRYKHYITLTNEEAHYIFNEETQNMHTIIPFPPNINNIDNMRDIVDFYRGEGDFHFSIKDRNILSLCLNEEIKNVYLNFLQQEKPDLYEYQHEWLEHILENFPTDSIINTILDFVGQEDRAAFVICDAPKSILESLKQFLNKRGLTTNYYQYDALKKHSINERKIVVLCFCPHNLSSDYNPKYPNSFDEYELEEGQSIIEIINEMAFVDYCKYKYEYDLRLCAITSSQFRVERLGGNLRVPQRPHIQIVYEESEDDNERKQQGSIPTYSFILVDGTTCRIPESEILICENGNHERFINSIRDLKGEEDEDGQERLFEITAFQPISELADSTMDTFFKDPQKNPLLLEKIESEKYINRGLIPQDHNRDIPIWKYLLERRIREYCVQHNVIENNQQKTLWDLLRQKFDNEYIKKMYSQMSVTVGLKYVLETWCDLTKEKPLVPGSRINREKILIDYLGLDKRIVSLYRNKQLLRKNQTREKNKITEDFLCRILFDDITDALAAELLDEYSEHLPIENKEDIETLKTIALENIKLKRIKGGDNSMQSDTEINSDETPIGEVSHTDEEIVNRANTSLKWAQYMNFLFERAEYMKKRMTDEEPIALNELDEIIKQIHDKFEEIESNSI